MFCDLHEVDQVSIRCSDVRTSVTFGLLSVVHRSAKFSTSVGNLNL